MKKDYFPLPFIDQNMDQAWLYDGCDVIYVDCLVFA